MTDEFDDLLKGFRGSQVTSLIRYRAGGHAGGDWAYPGDTARPGFGAMILVGAAKWTGTTAADGGFEIPLPAKFAGSPVAVVTPTLTVPTFTPVQVMAAPDSYQLTVYWQVTGAITQLWVAWIAVGMPVTG